MTNFEKFKQMLTIEKAVNIIDWDNYEMAKNFCIKKECNGNCEQCTREWLDQEVEE